MLLHRDVVAELRQGFFQIRLYRRLIFAVYQDSGIFDTEQLLQRLSMVHKHVSRGRAHEDLYRGKFTRCGIDLQH